MTVRSLRCDGPGADATRVGLTHVQEAVVIDLEHHTPDHVVIATASGLVTADDYEQVLMPAVDRALADGSKARLAMILSESFTGYEDEAMHDDAAFGMHHWGDFERIALVTDRESWRVMVRATGFLMPGSVRVFALADSDTARSWILD